MRDDLIVQLMREAIRKGALKSPQQRFKEMVELGVIDKEGNVLLRVPEPPKFAKPKRKKRST